MKIKADNVIRALERLKAWTEVEEQRVNFAAKNATNHDDDEIVYSAKAEILEQIGIRINTVIMVIEEVKEE